MKREILCANCNRETSILKAKYLTFEDIEEMGGVISLPLPISEQVKKVGGEARMQLQCDLCNRTIEKGEYCVAISIIGHGQQYAHWESHYISILRRERVNENVSTRFHKEA